MKASLQKVMLIINPISGTRPKDALPEMVASVVAAEGGSLEICPTADAADASIFARRAVAEAFSTVIVAGGDGTVSDVAAELRGASTALCIVPCGSGNGLARTLAIPPDFGGALKLLTEGKIMVCDNGLVNGRPFFCTCGVGFDAEVSRRFAMESRRGRLSYVKSALLDYIKYVPEPYAISIGGHIITKEAFLIAICNASQYGNNAYIAPQASLNDGLLDITIVHSGSLIDSMLAGIELFSGRIDRNMLVETFKVPRAVISRLHPGAAHIDGEPIELGRRLEVECQPATLRLVVPEEIPDFRPIFSPLRSMAEDIVSDVSFALKSLFFKGKF